MRVDAHVHVWDLEHGEYSWLTADLAPIDRTFRLDELEPQLDAVGIDRVVLVQAADTAADTDAMLSVASRNPHVAGVVGWVDLLDPEHVDSALDELSAHPAFIGVRHLIHDEPDSDWLARPEVRRSLERLAARGLSFDVVGVLPRHLEHALAIARELPELQVVIDHLGTPPAGRDDGAWSRVMGELAGEPNVAVKLSGLTTIASAPALRPFVNFAVDRFGAHRMLYGGDWPVSTLATDYAETFATLTSLIDGLSDDERDAVLGGTARRVYRLS